MSKTLSEMTTERKELEAMIINLIYGFQKKYECGVEIHTHYSQCVGNRYSELVDIMLEVKK